MESESSSTNQISDSGYSNSYSNSQGSSPSQKSRSASSNSRHSCSNSSRSSGYCGAANQDGSSSVDIGLPPPRRYKDKDHKKKRLKATITANLATIVAEAAAAALPDVTVTTIPTDDAEPKDKSVFLLPIENQDVQMASEKATVPLVVHPLVSSLPSAIEPELPLQDAKLMEVTESATAKPNQDLSVTADAEALPLDENNQKPTFAKDFEIEQPFETEKKDKDIIPNEKEETTDNNELGFCCVVSMYDGLVLYTDPSLTTVLGFPKDMWLGRSFIDFIHPKDRETFSNQVTTGIALPLVEGKVNTKVADFKMDFFVCLRKYRGLESAAIGAVENPVSYQACHLAVTIKHVPAPFSDSLPESNSGKFLVVVAVPVQSSYKVPRERKQSSKFGMRHNTKCILNHVDPDVVTNFGFLPQDMLGKSVFDFCHPEDMPFLKDVYKSVVKTCQIDGSVFRSKPYRFLVQNGCFAMIETEWTSFVNPWSRRLEFVISLHRVLQGPMNPDVFAVFSDEEFKNISKEVIRTGKILQAEIIQLLNEDIPRSAEPIKQEVSKRCKDLAGFMESLMSGVSKPNLQLELPKELDVSISDRSSVMLGEISPQNEYYDSKSSSETPPSYNQLNYNENIKRFFQSKPKTTVSDESNGAQNSDQEEKKSQECRNTQLSPENSGGSGSGSGEILSSDSNQNMDSGTTSGTNTTNDESRPPLTQSILVRHNEDMEKLMAKKHKALKHNDRDKCHKRGQHKNEKNQDQKFGDNNEHAHGLKRSGSATGMEGDYHKVSRHERQPEDSSPRFERNQNSNNGFQHIPRTNASGHFPGFSGMAPPRENVNYQPTINDVNFFPVVNPVHSMGTQRGTLPAQGMPGPSSADNGSYPSTPVVPFFYIPTVPPRASYMEPIPRYPVQYMPSVFYNTVFPSSPVLCSPLPVVSVPLAPTSTTPMAPPDMRHLNNFTHLKINTAGTNEPGDIPMHDDRFGHIPNSDSANRPPSQATSVKAEPGSKMGSSASVSGLNKALSESSRKEMGLLSVCSPDSPLVSPADGETQHFNAKTNEHSNSNAGAGALRKPPPPIYRSTTLDESSSCYSSSYSSFLKTDTGSRSNDSNYHRKRSDDGIWRHQKNQPMMRKKEPQWLESVAMSSDLIYRYQIAVQNIEDILEADLKKLKKIEQPAMVNEQLNQLYIEMELEGLSKALTLEEEFSSSSSSGEDNNIQTKAPSKNKKKRRSYGSLMMIYEEDAPFPSPEQNQQKSS